MQASDKNVYHLFHNINFHPESFKGSICLTSVVSANKSSFVDNLAIKSLFHTNIQN